MTRILRPWARSMTREPMLPVPITPRVFWYSSTPANLDFSHLSVLMEAVAWGTLRAAETIRARACSAVVTVLPKGVFMTMTPFWEAVGMSTLSTPIPARPITFRLAPASMISAVALVAERMARPS